MRGRSAARGGRPRGGVRMRGVGRARGVCPARRRAAYPPSLSHRPGRPEIGPTRPRSARAGQHRSADSTRRPSRPGPDSTRPGVHRKRRSCRSRLAAAVLAAAAAAARAWRSRWDPVQVRQSISSARARAASLLVRASGQVSACVCACARSAEGRRQFAGLVNFGVDSVERVARLSEMRPGPGFQPRRLALRRARQAPRWASPGDSMRFIPPARRPTRPACPPKVHRDRPAGPGPPPLGHRPGPARRPEIGPGSSGPLAEQGGFPCPCTGPG